jgi:hypothetical protein
VSLGLRSCVRAVLFVVKGDARFLVLLSRVMRAFYVLLYRVIRVCVGMAVLVVGVQQPVESRPTFPHTTVNVPDDDGPVVDPWTLLGAAKRGSGH